MDEKHFVGKPDEGFAAGQVFFSIYAKNLKSNEAYKILVLN